MFKQNLVNHIGLVLDASGSMSHHASALIKIADDQVAYLAQRSKDLNQETRVSVWTFDDTVKCLVWDMDVLRLPSIARLYEINGRTALIDATVQAIGELSEIPQRYGDHAFLQYVLTDGEENASRKNGSFDLQQRLTSLPENWTVAVLVPNMQGKFAAKGFGFPNDNIAVWDATSKQGLEEAAKTIRTATDNYMNARATGTRSTRNLFTMTAVDPAALKAAGITPLALDRFQLVHVPVDAVIQPFVESCGLKYVLGMAYYEMVKRERIQPQKKVAIMNRKTAEVYVGLDARKLLGLPDEEVRVSPGKFGEYRVFIQSTSVNRKLPAHSGLLLLS